MKISRRKNCWESSDPYYDLLEDYDLIASSFSTQYGIRLYKKDFEEMSWMEFRALLEGLGPDTPLGRIVSIRSEQDKDILKNFTPEQKRIRNEWRKRKAEEISKEGLDEVLESFKNLFIRAAGGMPNERTQV